IQKATAQARRGVLARCPGLVLIPRVQRLVWTRGHVSPGKPVTFRLQCSIDCAFTAKVGSNRGATASRFSGRIVAKTLTSIRVRAKLRPGAYRLLLSLVAPLNPGKPVNLRSPFFSIPKTKTKAKAS